MKIKNIVAMVLVLALVLSLSVGAGAITTGAWGETNYGASQLVSRTVSYDYAGGFALRRELWRWQVITGAEYTDYGSHLVPEEVPWRFGFRFAGWRSDNGAVYQPGDRIAGSEDVNLTAIWEAVR